MTDHIEPAYNVFISHSQADRDWVDDWLLPRLEDAGLRVAVDYRDFIAGLPRIKNIEHFVKASHRTIAVITPDWLDSEWNAFEDLLVRTLDPAARKRKLIPVLLKQSDLPEALAALEPINLTSERFWDHELRRLTRDLRDVIPVPPPWIEPGGWRSGQRWGDWLRRYRREIWRALLLALLVWLSVSVLLQLPPFDPGPGWQRIGDRMSHAYRMSRVGDALLVATTTDFPGCESAEDTGLWLGTDQGQTWRRIPVPALKFQEPDGKCALAAFTDFASTPAAPLRVYGSTVEAGMLRSDDGGHTWSRIGEDALPARLESTAANPDDPDHILATASIGGVYRSQDGGSTWQRLDGEATCASPEQQGAGLPANFRAGSLLYTENALYVGADAFDAPGALDGLYASLDGGSCWRRIDDALGRYQYLDLAGLPGESDELLALTFDFRAPQGEEERALWRVSHDQGRVLKLWETGIAADKIAIDPSQPGTWYVSTGVGSVIVGSVDQGQTGRLSRITHCLPCLVDMAPDFESGVPLLLAGERIYRWAEVPWLRRLWP